MNNKPTSAKDIFNSINNSQIYHYRKDGTISATSGETTLSFKTDNLPMWCFFPYITLTNANGNPIDITQIDQNLILLNIKVIRADNYFGQYNFTLQSFNELYLSEQFSGFKVEGNTEYEFTFTAQNIPSTAIDMPYSVSINLLGYQLGYKSTVTWNDARRKFNFRYSQEKQYTLTTPTSTTTGSQNTFRTPKNGLLVDTMRCDVIDANGKILKESDYQDEFVISLYYNQNLLLLNNLPLRVFNKIFKSKRFKKFCLVEDTDYTINVIGTGNSNITAKRLNYDTMTQPFLVGDTITGGTSSATGVIVDVVQNGASGYFILKTVTGTFVDNEAITGAIEGIGAVNGTINTGLSQYNLTFNLKFDGYQLTENPNE